MPSQKTKNGTAGKTLGGAKRLEHRKLANEAYAKGDLVGALNHVKAYNQAVKRQNWFMQQSDTDKQAFIESKGGKWKKGK